MNKRQTIRTMLLGLAVILITFSLFFALPKIISPLDQIDSDILIWACSMRGKPIIYDNWFWHSDEQPDAATIEKSVRDMVTTEGILFGLKKSSIYGGFGTLDITVHPEHENLVVVSGYLQYGSFPESETDTDYLSIPVPKMVGTLGRRLIRIILTNIYENVTTTTEKVLLTDSDGFFSFTLEPDTDSVCFRIQAEFEEEITTPVDPKAPITMHRGSRVAYVTCAEDIEFFARGIPWWVWVLLGISVTAVITGLYRYYVKKQVKLVQRTPVLYPTEEISTLKPSDKKAEETGGDVSEVLIGFPDTQESLPAVWEANTTLTIHITFRDRHGNVVPSLPGNVDFGEGDVIQVTTDEDGSIQVSHVYAVKGDYTITAGYTDKSGKAVSSWRTIRIVDYREEMVRLFGELLEELDLADIKIGRDMTPREVERLLSERLENVPKESIRKVIEGFEEANYSTHPVNRERYVRMYKAIGEIIGK